MLQSPSSRCSSERGGQTIGKKKTLSESVRLPLVAVGVTHTSAALTPLQSGEVSHLEDVAQRHGSVGEAVDKQRLQQPLQVVEGVTHAGQTGEKHRHRASIVGTPRALHRLQSCRELRARRGTPQLLSPKKAVSHVWSCGSVKKI